MAAIITFLVIVFAVAGYLGLRFYRSSIWNIVDLVYYPLAAVGVALLFVNNATQRQLFELGRMEEKHKADLQALLSAKPDVRTIASGELVDSSFRLIANIAEISAICKKIPKVDPQCMVAENLEPSVTTFLQAAQAEYASPELKLSGACSAAEHMLDDMRSKDQISSLVGDELIGQYKTAVAKNYDPLAYEAVTAEAQAFEQRALGQVEWLRNAVKYDDSESMRLVLAMRRSEVDFGKTILQGLYPCIVAPKKDLDLLVKWTTSRQSEEEEIKRLERDRQQSKDSSSGDPLLLWIHLNLWPLIIISALSLKFAKGAATFRKVNPSPDKRGTREPNEPDTTVQAAQPLQASPEEESPKDVAVQSSSESPTIGVKSSMDDIDSTFGKPPSMPG